MSYNPSRTHSVYYSVSFVTIGGEVNFFTSIDYNLLIQIKIRVMLIRITSIYIEESTLYSERDYEVRLTHTIY